MYLNEADNLGFLGIKLPSLKSPVKVAGAGMQAMAAPVTAPLTGLAKLFSGAQNLAQRAVDARIQYAQTKQLWKNPFGFSTQAQTQPVTTQLREPEIEQKVRSTNVLTTPGQISTLQQNLNALGFSAGKVDGFYGPNTRAGILAFQRANGLQADGLATQAVLAATRTATNLLPSGSTNIRNNPSAPTRTSQPQPPVVQGPPSYFPMPQLMTAPPVDKSLPVWVIPAAIGGVGLLLVATMGRK